MEIFCIKLEIINYFHILQKLKGVVSKFFKVIVYRFIGNQNPFHHFLKYSVSFTNKNVKNEGLEKTFYRFLPPYFNFRLKKTIFHYVSARTNLSPERA